MRWSFLLWVGMIGLMPLSLLEAQDNHTTYPLSFEAQAHKRVIRKRFLETYLPGCRRFYDGCNICTLMDRSSITCTKRQCRDKNRVPRCLDTIDTKNHEDLLQRYRAYKAIYQKRPTSIRRDNHTRSYNRKSDFGTRQFKSNTGFKYKTFNQHALRETWRDRLELWKAKYRFD